RRRAARRDDAGGEPPPLARLAGRDRGDGRRRLRIEIGAGGAPRPASLPVSMHTATPGVSDGRSRPATRPIPMPAEPGGGAGRATVLRAAIGERAIPAATACRPAAAASDPGPRIPTRARRAATATRRGTAPG